MKQDSSSHKLTVLPSAAGKNAIDKVSTYKVNGKTFIVQPVFQPEGPDTIGTILLRLMRAEVGGA